MTRKTPAIDRCHLALTGAPWMCLKSFFGEVAEPHPCAACAAGNVLYLEIRMAFQPIVQANTREIYAYEALVRGANGAGAIISRLGEHQICRFLISVKCQ